MIRKLELQQQRRPARQPSASAPGSANAASSDARGGSTGVASPAADPWASHDFEDVLLGGLMPATAAPPPLPVSHRDLGVDLDPGLACGDGGGGAAGDVLLKLDSGSNQQLDPDVRGGSSIHGSWDTGDASSYVLASECDSRAGGGLNPVLRLIRKKQLQRRLRLRGTLAAEAAPADMPSAAQEHWATAVGLPAESRRQVEVDSDWGSRLEIGPQDAVGGRAMFNPVYRYVRMPEVFSRPRRGPTLCLRRIPTRSCGKHLPLFCLARRLIRKKQLIRKRASRSALADAASASLAPSGDMAPAPWPSVLPPANAPMPQWGSSPGAFFDLMLPLDPGGANGRPLGTSALHQGNGGRGGSWLGPAGAGASADLDLQLQLDPMVNALDPMAASAAGSRDGPPSQLELPQPASVVELSPWAGRAAGGWDSQAPAPPPRQAPLTAGRPGGMRRVSEALADLMVGERAPMNHVYRLIRKKELQLQMRKRSAQGQEQASSAGLQWEQSDMGQLAVTSQTAPGRCPVETPPGTNLRFVDHRRGKRQSSTTSDIDAAVAAPPMVGLPESRRQRITELKVRGVHRTGMEHNAKI